jgi:hypothetical protein
MVTDIEVLTEDATQIAAGEEYSARAPLPDQDAFLTEMGPDGTNKRHLSNTAKA